MSDYGLTLYWEPKVYLVAAPAVTTGMQKFLEDHAPGFSSDVAREADFLSEVAGRVCYYPTSFTNPRPGGNKGYLDNIKSSGHGSVIEHPNFCFIFTQISRTLSHELVRHRAGWGYSQLSQRFVDSSEAGYVVPAELADSVREALGEGLFAEPIAASRVGHEWLMTVKRCHHAYAALSEALMPEVRHRAFESYLAARKVEGHSDALAYEAWWEELGRKQATDLRKAVRGTARSVLPGCTETKVFATANVRALRHFLEMRASVHADREIRALAVAAYRAALPFAPNLLADYEARTGPDGTEHLHTPWRKV